MMFLVVGLVFGVLGLFEICKEVIIQVVDIYQCDDLFVVGEGVFGKGVVGFVGILEKVLVDQGQFNVYIVGCEVLGVFVVGFCYGLGVMSYKVEGQQLVYWMGLLVGFDVGGDVNKVFVLVYNFYDIEELFCCFFVVEGWLYLVGGFVVIYLCCGNVVLILICFGVGWCVGVNVGYMNIMYKSWWLLFQVKCGRWLCLFDLCKFGWWGFSFI